MENQNNISKNNLIYKAKNIFSGVLYSFLASVAIANPISLLLLIIATGIINVSLRLNLFVSEVQENYFLIALCIFIFLVFECVAILKSKNKFVKIGLAFGLIFIILIFYFTQFSINTNNVGLRG